jgi:hypothetical protein
MLIKNYLSRLEILVYHTRRENINFAVVNRAWTTSKTPAKLLIIPAFLLCYRINVIALIAVVLTYVAVLHP